MAAFPLRPDAGDVVVVGPLLDRLMHHGHLLKFDGKSWRLHHRLGIPAECLIKPLDAPRAA